MRGACQAKRRIYGAWCKGQRCRWGCLTAVALLLLVVAGGDSLATCPPKPEKLYTSDETKIKALLDRLEPFEQDIQAVLADMRTAQSDDEWNHSAGQWAEVGNYYVEGSKAFCSAVNMMNQNLARPCKVAQDVSDGITNLVACSKGKATGCVGVVLQRAKIKLKSEKGKIEGRSDGLDNIGEHTSKQVANSLKQAGTEAASGANKVAKGDKAGGLAALCKGGMILKDSLNGQEFCSIGSSVANMKENYDLGRELDAATKENEARRTKLIQQLEAKVSTVSEKIKRLRAEVYAINWGKMTKPEPIMTSINGEECEDEATDEEIQRSLSKMKKPSRLSSLRSASPAEVDPAEAEPSFFNAETLGAVLQGTAQALSTISAERAAKNNASQKEGNCPNGIRPTGTGQYVICREPGRAIGFQGNADVGKDPPIDPLGGGGYSGRKHISGR